MRVHESWLDCVVFVGRILEKGSREEKRLTGTAFVAGMELADKSGYVFYLVTARHVADGLEAGGEWFIRFNNDGVADELRLHHSVKWVRHPDPDQALSVDAAVLPLPLPISAKLTVIPVETFATDELLARHRVGIGSEGYIIGLFTKMTGNAKNVPLVRTTSIAMMPAEKVPLIKIGTNFVGESEVYLLEGRSHGGLSGAPVFVIGELQTSLGVNDGSGKRTQMKFVGTGEHFFLGLMHGHWLIQPRDANDVEIQSVRDGEGTITTGISIVVPAKKILEVLNHPELEEQRNAIVQARLAAVGTGESYV